MEAGRLENKPSSFARPDSDSFTTESRSHRETLETCKKQKEEFCQAVAFLCVSVVKKMN